MMELWCPDGYVTFKSVLGTARSHICECDSWEIPDSLFESADKSAESLAVSTELGSSEAGQMTIELRLNFLKRQMARFLAWGRLRAAGIESSTGRLMAIPADVWRIPPKEPVKFALTVFGDAFAGRDLRIPISGGTFTTCRPIVALKDLAIAFGAKSPPAAPTLVPSEWSDDVEPLTTSPAALRDATAAAALMWMRAYAQGMNDAGAKPKRDPSLELCAEKTGCTSRQAVSAWNALPESWKNPPRTPKP